MSPEVLSYAPRIHRDARLAGIVMMIWGVFLIPSGAFLAFVGYLFLYMLLVWAGRETGLVLLSAGLLLLGVGLAQVWWGIKTFKVGIALAKGKTRPLRRHIQVTKICEWAAYLGIPLYIAVCIRDHVWKNHVNLTYAIVGLPLYLLLPWLLTSTKLTLKRAEKTLEHVDVDGARS